jgi:phosphoribosylanthranilate isomerase
MPDNLKIKVCGMREPHNIGELIACKPDFMGFIFYPRSKRYLQHPDRELFRKIPPGVEKVGVYVDESTEKIREMAAFLELNLVQLHGDETPGDCSNLMESGIPVMKAFRISGSLDNEMMKDYADSCVFFLFDTSGSGFGGTGLQFDWRMLAGYRLSKPFILSGGIGPEDIAEILNIHHPAMAGIDINSRFEIRPGLKDIKKVSEFMQSIRRKQQ